MISEGGVETEQLYTPYVVSDAERRHKAPLHFAFEGETRTRCGRSTENMDSGCLSTDMDITEVRQQQGPCIRCMQAIERTEAARAKTA